MRTVHFGESKKRGTAAWGLLLWWHYKRPDFTPEPRFRLRVAAFQAITAFLGRVKERGWGEVPPGVYLTQLGTCLAEIYALGYPMYISALS